MGAQGCAKEAEHNESAFYTSWGTRYPVADKPLDNKRATVVGQSRAKVARRMAQMAATEDDEGQHGKLATTIFPER